MNRTPAAAHGPANNLPPPPPAAAENTTESFEASWPFAQLNAAERLLRDHRSGPALRQSEEFSRRVVATSPDCIKVLDLDGRLVWMSENGQRLLEIADLTQYLNTCWPDWWSGPAHALAAQAIETARAGGVGRFEGFTPTASGTPKWWDVIVSALCGPDGKPERLLCVSRDITEWKRARDRAAQATRAKDEFIAVLSHELRAPLTPALLTLSLIESRADIPADLRSDLDAIRRHIELESQLIGDLLDMTRVVNGNLQLDVRPIDLHAIIRSAADIEHPGGGPPVQLELAAERPFVAGDAVRLEQVFWNLINNARKFTPSSGRITVRSSHPADARLQVEVIDTGPGIDPSVLPRLFAAFEQGELRAERQFAGLGLGLAISRRLVEAHGGTIRAASLGRGRGATFTVELPISAAPADPVPRAPAAGGAEQEGPLRILVVEDHESTRAAMVRLLQKLGHRATGVGTLADARQAAAHEEFDLLLSDLGLPDGSGLDLMRELDHRYHHRGIALTGYGMEQDVRESRKAGFAAHLTKPVNVSRLRQTIRQVYAAGRDSAR